MTIEQKTSPAFTKAVDVDTRTVIGIAAVHGNIDEGNDRSWPNSFETEVNGRNRVRFLWQHNSMEPPIAAINYIREVPRAELPKVVLDYAPEATGGVEVSRTYLTDPFADRIFQGIRAGAIAEMSYAYEPTKVDFEQVDGRGQVRNLRTMKIYDISDVTWGMNPATSADGLKGLPAGAGPLSLYAVPVEASVAHLRAFVHEALSLEGRREKAGRVLSEANLKLVDGTIETAEELLKMLRELRTRGNAEDPEKASAADSRAARRAWMERRQALLQLTGA